MTHPRFINLRQGGNMPPARAGRIRSWIADTIGIICLVVILAAGPLIIYAMGCVQ